MPNLNKTELAVILDRSGSMGVIQKDMEGGFATFIADQLKAPGELVVSLYQFDDKFDTLFEELPAAEVRGIKLRPRGSTALFDAVAKATVLIGERLAKKPENQRPGAVIVLVITDGEENASAEYAVSKGGAARVRDIVKHQESAYNWRYAYLGSSDGGLSEAKSIFSVVAGFDANAQGVQDNYASASRGVRSYRSAVANNDLDVSLSIATTGTRSDNK